MTTSGSFTGKVAFVTGAGSGIGRATALAFAGEGANVVVADITEQDNQETVRMIQEAGGQARAVRRDVTRSDDVQAALNTLVDEFGHLDVASTVLWLSSDAASFVVGHAMVVDGGQTV